MSDAIPMISLERVTRRYGDAIAVDELSLDIERGAITVLIGPSGCGKTTTLRMINRLVEPDSGRILLDGEDTATLAPESLRRGIGYVIQSIGLFPHMTVGQNVCVVPDLLGWPRARGAARADELLELIGLEPARYRDSYPHELSGGQQQRVGVARALAADPPVLLMDEPFGAVDPLGRERLQDEFLALQETLRKTIVIVTHDIDEAIRLGDRICVMHEGRVQQHDTVARLLEAPATPFVRRFVGHDRALKRLGSLSVSSCMRPFDAAAGEPDDASETDRSGGADDADAALREDDDLGEALSRMLGEGVVSLPVRSASGELVGHVDLDAIARLGGRERTAREPGPP